MKSNFYSALYNLYFQSLSNYFIDNYDELRFGNRKRSITKSLKGIIHKKYLKKQWLIKFTDQIFDKNSSELTEYEKLYNILNNSESQNLLISLICYKILGDKYVKLPIYSSFQSSIKKIEKIQKKIKNPNSYKFLGDKLIEFRLESDFNLSLLCHKINLITTFLLQQYAYKVPQLYIEADKGDVVIDAGACWGDTSLYFASKVGNSGKVYAFEFIPKNLEIFNHNINLNPELKDTIEVINKPLWSSIDKELYFSDEGPASFVSDIKTEKTSNSTRTTNIDEIVKQHKIDKIDFIKMDIEGAEIEALNGAMETIKTHKPKLAIAIYHSFNDFVQIPQMIHSLNLGYKLYLGHFTIHNEETILFATVK